MWCHVKGEKRGFRFWWHLTEKLCVSIEAYVFCLKCAVGVRVSDDGGVTWYVSVPLIGSVYISLDGFLPQSFTRKYDWHDLSVRIHDWSLWVNLWCDDSCSSPSKPFWHKHRRRFVVHSLDILFGKHKYTKHSRYNTEVEIPMPERTYRASVEFYRAMWKRSRLPFTRELMRADITPEIPIPVPGKGESDYDCGEDAVHSMTTEATTEHEAVAAIVKSVLRDRYRYGSRCWRSQNKQLEQQA